MKNIKIIITFLLLSLTVKAQKVPYEKLEAFSKEISQLQLETNGKSYNDGTNTIEISFPEENFTVSLYSPVATNVVYKKSAGKELMYLTENILISWVAGFTSEIIDNNIIVWKINFGKFYVTTQIFEHGKLIDTTIKNELLLYSYLNKNLKATDPTFFNSFSDLCNTMKKSIDMITDKELESENRDWKDENITRAEFAKKHPNSVRTMQAKNIIANKEKARLKEGEEAFMNYNPSNYKLGLSIEDTKKEYPQFKLKINKDNTDELLSSDGNVKFYIKNGKVYGYTDAISYNMDRKNNYLIHKETFKIGNKNKNDLEAKFKFPPYISESDISHFSYNYEKYSLIPSNEDFSTRKFRYKNGDKISYTWKKNGKTVQLEITFNIIDKLLTVIIGHNITITVIDEHLVE